MCKRMFTCTRMYRPSYSTLSSPAVFYMPSSSWTFCLCQRDWMLLKLFPNFEFWDFLTHTLRRLRRNFTRLQLWHALSVFHARFHFVSPMHNHCRNHSNQIENFRADQLQPYSQISWKFGTQQWTHDVLFRAELHFDWCTLSPRE